MSTELFLESTKMTIFENVYNKGQTNYQGCLYLARLGLTNDTSGKYGYQ